MIEHLAKLAKRMTDDRAASEDRARLVLGEGRSLDQRRADEQPLFEIFE